jgi:hypothetical protein
MKAPQRKKITKTLVLTVLLLGGFLFSVNSEAAVRKEFNYQGKLTDGSSQAVADGTYDITFKIYNQAGGGTPAWTESWTASALFIDAGTTVSNDGCATGVDKIVYTTNTNAGSLLPGQTLWNVTKKQSAVIESVNTSSSFICVYDPASLWANGDQVTNRIYVKNGLFSVMVGSLTPQTLDFTADTYYMGVTIGSDSEMTPRKRLGSVPQAWNANSLAGTGFIDIDNTSANQDAGNINYNPAGGTKNAFSVIYGTGGGTGTALSVKQNGTGNILDVQNTAGSVLVVGSSGQVGIGVAPTAVLHLKAGTAAAGTAPLKFTSGTNLGTAEAGTMEYDGTNLYFTPGTVRKTVAFLDSNITGTAANVTGTVSVANGGTGAGTFTVNGILYGNGTSALSVTAAGTNNYILYSNNGVPAWTNAPTITGTNITGLSASNVSAGTLGVAYGGTGAGTLTGVLKGNGTSAFTAMTGSTGYSTYWSDANTLSAEQYLAPARGGLGFNASTVAKGGIVTGTGGGTFGITALGTDGYCLTASSAAAGGVTWASCGGSSGVNLQSGTPGTAQTGNLDISGTGIFGTSVGVGNTSPTGGKLQVDQAYNGTGAALYLNQSSGTWGSTTLFNNYRFIQTNSAATDGNYRQFSVGAGGVSIGYANTPIYGSSDALYVNGNVGIGTSSPSTKLQVAGNIAAYSSDTNFTELWSDNAIIYGNGSALRFGSANNLVGGSFSEKMRIDTSGKVGIGTTPVTALDIAGYTLKIKNTQTAAMGTEGSGSFFGSNQYASGAGTWTNDVAANPSGMVYFDSSGNINFYTRAASGTPAYGTQQATITNGGSVGIGVSPSAKLDVRVAASSSDGVLIEDPSAHNIRIAPSLGAANYNAIVQANDQAIIFSNGLTIAPWITGPSGLRMDINGNVSIGAATASYKLDVTGDIRATGTIYANTSGGKFFQGGDDSGLWDINVANTMGLYGNQDATVGSLKLGSGGGTLSGYSGNIGVGTTAPTNTLTVDRAATVPGTIGSYHISLNVAGTQYLTLGADTTYAYIQSWNSKPLYLNSVGNAIYVGAGGLVMNGGITYSSNRPLRSLILTPSGATVPNTNGASQVKTDATNNSFYELVFDPNTAQSAYWSWTMPDSYDNGTINVTYYWAGTSTGGNVLWCFQAFGASADGTQSIDKALGSAVCAASATPTTTGNLMAVTSSGATSNFAAGNYVSFKVYRDAANAGDTNIGNARLVKVKIEYSAGSESD